LYQQYLKKYDEAVATSSKPIQEPVKQSTKQPMEKQKELRYAKSLLKVKAEGPSESYHFGSTG